MTMTMTAIPVPEPLVPVKSEVLKIDPAAQDAR